MKLPSSFESLLKRLEAEASKPSGARSIVPLREPRAPRSMFAGNSVSDAVLGKPFRWLTYTKVSHGVLDRHTNIAFDMDDTLVDGRQSWFWRRWVRDNHTGRNLWILTFRTMRAVDTIWSELESCEDPVEREWFQGIRSIPRLLWFAWANLPPPLREVDDPSKVTKEIASLTLRQTSYDLHYLIEINQAMRAWKAATAKELGCTILVEDREAFCKPYCDVAGIEFLNAIKG